MMFVGRDHSALYEGSVLTRFCCLRRGFFVDPIRLAACGSRQVVSSSATPRSHKKLLALLAPLNKSVESKGVMRDVFVCQALALFEQIESAESEQKLGKVAKKEAAS